MVKVMILEDEPFISAHIEELLTEYGIPALGPFRSNAEALRFLQTQTPDAAIVDLNLADGASHPTVERLCALGVPFLVVSGSSQASAGPGALQDAEWLEKPFSEQSLIRILIGLVQKMHRHWPGFDGPALSPS